MKLPKFEFHYVDLAASLKKKKRGGLEELLIKLLNTSSAAILVICSSARNKTSWSFPAPTTTLCSWMLTFGKRFSVSELLIPQSLPKLGLVIVFPKAATTIQTFEFWVFIKFPPLFSSFHAITAGCRMGLLSCSVSATHIWGQRWEKWKIPVDLSVFMQVVQPLQHLLKDCGYTGFIQDTSLVFSFGHNVLYNIQNRAWRKELNTLV